MSPTKTKRIERLTAEEEARLPEYARKWTAIGLSTVPADRKLAEEGINEAYEKAGLERPALIVWGTSPIAIALTRAIVEKIARDGLVGESVGESVGQSVWQSVWQSVGESVWQSVWQSVGQSVWQSVGQSVGESVWQSVRQSVGRGNGYGFGQHDANLLGFYEYFHELGLKDETEKLSGLWKIARSAGWYLPHKNICWISERHNILRLDSRGRLHCEDGLACGYPDGWGVCAWHGVRVPEWIIMEPHKITIETIHKEENAEIRRVMIERFGDSRYLTESNAKAVDFDFDTKGNRRELLRLDWHANMPVMQMLRVVNSTPEPDGSSKTYFLGVPSSIRSVKEGVAWTFGLTTEEYLVTLES